MGDIDAEAKAVLEVLIPGQQDRLLTTADLEILARWIYLKTMMYEFVQPLTQVGNADDWRDFYETRRPPRNAAIWIGPQDASDASWESRLTTLSIAVPEQDENPFITHYTLDTMPLNTLTATLGIGTFFAQSFYGRFPDRISMDSRVCDADDAFKFVGVQQIWPNVPNEFLWQPKSPSLAGEATISTVGGYIYQGLSGSPGPI